MTTPPTQTCADCGARKDLHYCCACDAYYCPEHCCYNTKLSEGNKKATLIMKKSIRRKGKKKDA